jgi:uncharacterized protein YcbK (DUF882 family)
MSKDLISKLQILRDICGFPFIINSGYRTPAHNKKVGGTKTSSHLKGLAADIHCINSKQRYLIISNALSLGFSRVGIGARFIHLDVDTSKQGSLIWLY